MIVKNPKGDKLFKLRFSQAKKYLAEGYTMATLKEAEEYEKETGRKVQRKKNKPLLETKD